MSRPVEQGEPPAFHKPLDNRSVPDSQKNEKPVIKRNDNESHPTTGNAPNHDGVDKNAKPSPEHNKKVQPEKNSKTDKDVQPGKDNQE